mmetsp:Transcript_23151/g.38759  ORF Transcript_23151/g.38759 Transcript_23151/m.38759 type:complete len:85 (+) Transcript_23151:104-358(+)
MFLLSQIREKVELLLRPDAMEKAAQAVRLLTANNLNPSATVQRQPILLLVHEPLYNFCPNPNRSRRSMSRQTGGYRQISSERSD